MNSTADAINEFIERGYTVARGAIPSAFAAEWWEPTRSWLEAQEPSRLAELGSHLYFPRRRTFLVDHIAPDLGAMIRLLLSASCQPDRSLEWGDGFVVANPGACSSAAASEKWHKDGFFRHFLDSPEIGLVCLILWTDVDDEDGATLLAEGSVASVARLLYERSEGVPPEFFQEIPSDNWVETPATGSRGDVYLMHPFLLHARQVNRGHRWRAISNPSVPLGSPLSFAIGPGPGSAVEAAIVRVLGAGLCFARTGPAANSGEMGYANEVPTQRALLAEWLAGGAEGPRGHA